MQSITGATRVLSALIAFIAVLLVCMNNGVFPPLLWSQVAGVDWEYNGYGGDLYPEWQLDTSNAREAMDHMQIKTQVRVWLLCSQMGKRDFGRDLGSSFMYSQPRRAFNRPVSSCRTCIQPVCARPRRD
jgi:hypothetical protein